MARKLEREEQRHQQQGNDLEKMRAQMEKLRANCPHVRIEMRQDGVVVCKDCLEEVAVAKSKRSGDYEDEE